MAAQKKEDRNILRGLAQFFKLVAREEAPEVARAIDKWTYDTVVRSQLEEKGYRLSDLFVEGTEQFAIAYRVVAIDAYDGYPEIDRATLYQFPVTNDGVTVTVGEPTQVKQMFVAVQRSKEDQPSLAIYRDKDGTARFYATGSSAVMNKDGQFDSKSLYDSMIRNTEVYGMPYLTLFHKGKQRKIGEIVGVRRVGPLYVGGGTFDKGELPEAVIRAVEKDPSAFGISIGFFPTAAPKKERIGGVETLIYTQGINEEWSILPQERACAWFTNIKVERTVDKEFEQFMGKIFPDNPELAKKYGTDTEQRAAAVEGSGAVQRATEDAAATDATAAATPTPEVAAKDIHFELTDDAISAIAAKVVDSETIKTFLTTQTRSANDAAERDKVITAQAEVIVALEKRIAALEKPELQKQREWQAEKPRGADSRVIIGLPPSQTRAAAAATDKNAKVNKLPEAEGNPLGGMEFGGVDN